MFAVVALVCAGAAVLSGVHDLAVALFALPIFIVPAVMGMRRSGQWDAIARVQTVKRTLEEEPAEEEEAAA
jgi:hypothetical protein